MLIWSWNLHFCIRSGFREFSYFKWTLYHHQFVEWLHKMNWSKFYEFQRLCHYHKEHVMVNIFLIELAQNFSGFNGFRTHDREEISKFYFAIFQILLCWWSNESLLSPWPYHHVRNAKSIFDSHMWKGELLEPFTFHHEFRAKPEIRNVQTLVRKYFDTQKQRNLLPLAFPASFESLTHT